MAGSTPLRSKRPGSKAASYLSHEFIIQNHGDIATCICMIFVVGLMFQVEFSFYFLKFIIFLCFCFVSNLNELFSCLVPLVYVTICLNFCGAKAQCHRIQRFSANSLHIRHQRSLLALLLLGRCRHLSCHRSRVHFGCKLLSYFIQLLFFFFFL